MFFAHYTPFATNVTNVVSVDGSLNVRTKMQLGDYSATTFSDANSKLYIYTPAGGPTGNGIRIRHGGTGYSGIKIVSYSDATAFVVSNGTGLTTDGPETFKVEADGQTSITSVNTNAFTVKNASNSNQVTFNVGKTGLTEITTSNTDAFTVKNASSSNQVTFNVGKSGLTEITTSNTDAFVIKNASNSNQTAFKIEKDGKTLIGSKKIISTHLHANSFMQVEGKLACKELVILDATKWSDYVFSKDYRLMPLKELEMFYLTNKHLPDVPGDEEIKKNGINAAEMDALLLQKIEELTLHVVEMNKKIELLERENKNLKTK